LTKTPLFAEIAVLRKQRRRRRAVLLIWRPRTQEWRETLQERSVTR